VLAVITESEESLIVCRLCLKHLVLMKTTSSSEWQKSSFGQESLPSLTRSWSLIQRTLHSWSGKWRRGYCTLAGRKPSGVLYPSSSVSLLLKHRFHLKSLFFEFIWYWTVCSLLLWWHLLSQFSSVTVASGNYGYGSWRMVQQPERPIERQFKDFYKIMENKQASIKL